MYHGVYHNVPEVFSPGHSLCVVFGGFCDAPDTGLLLICQTIGVIAVDHARPEVIRCESYWTALATIIIHVTDMPMAARAPDEAYDWVNQWLSDMIMMLPTVGLFTCHISGQAVVIPDSHERAP